MEYTNLDNFIGSLFGKYHLLESAEGRDYLVYPSSDTTLRLVFTEPHFWTVATVDTSLGDKTRGIGLLKTLENFIHKFPYSTTAMHLKGLLLNSQTLKYEEFEREVTTFFPKALVLEDRSNLNYFMAQLNQVEITHSKYFHYWMMEYCGLYSEGLTLAEAADKFMETGEFGTALLQDNPENFHLAIFNNKVAELEKIRGVRVNKEELIITKFIMIDFEECILTYSPLSDPPWRIYNVSTDLSGSNPIDLVNEILKPGLEPIGDIAKRVFRETSFHSEIKEVLPFGKIRNTEIREYGITACVILNEDEYLSQYTTITKYSDGDWGFEIGGDDEHSSRREYEGRSLRDAVQEASKNLPLSLQILLITAQDPMEYFQRAVLSALPEINSTLETHHQSPHYREYRVVEWNEDRLMCQIFGGFRFNSFPLTVYLHEGVWNFGSHMCNDAQSNTLMGALKKFHQLNPSPYRYKDSDD